MGLGRKLFTLGAMAVGATVGALFAPHKGSKTRKDLAKKWSKGEHGLDVLKDTATKMGAEIAQTSKEVYEHEAVQKKKEELTKAATEAFEQGKKEAKEAGKKAQAHIKKHAKEAKKQVKHHAQKIKSKLKKDSDK